jgi:hypothetical protein
MAAVKEAQRPPGWDATTLGSAGTSSIDLPLCAWSRPTRNYAQAETHLKQVHRVVVTLIQAARLRARVTPGAHAQLGAEAEAWPNATVLAPGSCHMVSSRTQMHRVYINDVVGTGFA